VVARVELHVANREAVDEVFVRFEPAGAGGVTGFGYLAVAGERPRLALEREGHRACRGAVRAARDGIPGFGDFTSVEGAMRSAAEHIEPFVLAGGVAGRECPVYLVRAS